MNLESQLRALPSVDEVLQSIRDVSLPHDLKLSIVRDAIETARRQLRQGSAPGDIQTHVRTAIARLHQSSLRRVINATGVILHTNLGRAPLCEMPSGTGYSNLEYDLATGKRGKRDIHIAPWIERLTGKPGIAVNNNAAAVYLVLNELAAGAEVIVSRGELIEIGDGFRIPDIMLRAGVILREVGATNRTRIEDYRNAITDRTRLLLRVHPSNFRIEGFSSQPTLNELSGLARERAIPLYEDLGSGCITDLSPYGIREPLVRDSIAAGVNVVSFSGDKLLGGPQAGLIAGDPDLISRIRRNPMFRALRLDKLILAQLEQTLRLTALEQWDAIPTMRMIRLTPAAIRTRAEALLAQLPNLRATIIDGESKIGGGSTPEQSLPTALIAIECKSVTAAERTLRAADPPVIARIAGDRLLLDLRTAHPSDDPTLANNLRLMYALNEYTGESVCPE
ncbi:MAG: L-seryl-tRNA(Sec) selenium transferase [Acidobacteria bacterium]|nr:L-seryl-tRNA(Sec) selenium transferase [Acidobacteriota bacterium]